MADKIILSLAEKIEARRVQLQNQYQTSNPELIEPELKKYAKHLMRRGVKAPQNRKVTSMDHPMDRD